jgi:hypothetical protein
LIQAPFLFPRSLFQVLVKRERERERRREREREKGKELAFVF